MILSTKMPQLAKNNFRLVYSDVRRASVDNSPIRHSRAKNFNSGEVVGESATLKLNTTESARVGLVMMCLRQREISDNTISSDKISRRFGGPRLQDITLDVIATFVNHAETANA